MADIALAGIIIAALVARARLGFGFSLVFLPMAQAVIGFSEAFLMTVGLEVVSGVAMAWRHRTHLRLLDAVVMKSASYCGLVLGLLVTRVVDPQILVVVSMTVIVAACALFLWRRSLRSTSRGGMAVAGVASGLLNSYTGLSGPPVVLYYLRTEDDEQSVKGALTGYFALLYVITFVTLLATGEYAHFAHWRGLAIGAVLVGVAFPVVASVVDRAKGDLYVPSLLLMIASAVLVAMQTLW